MPLVKLLGGLGRLSGARRLEVDARTVEGALRTVPIPDRLLFPDGAFNRDVEVLVNGRNVAFLDGLATRLGEEDEVTIFLHGARGYPGG